MNYNLLVSVIGCGFLATVPATAQALKANFPSDTHISLDNPSDENIFQNWDKFVPGDKPEGWYNMYQTPQGGYRRVKFWLKAFIPREYESQFTVIQGIGPHSGKTGIDAPDGDFIRLGYGCFLTDQRGFSSAFTASARLNSFMEVDLISGRVTNVGHYSDPTIRADCQSGKELARATGDQSRSAFSPLSTKMRKASDEGFSALYETSLTASSGNPLTPSIATPQIDHKGGFYITHFGGNDGSESSSEVLLVSYEGKVDDFPYFEAYCQVDNYPPQKVFQRSAPSGKTLLELLKSLFGDASNTVSGGCIYMYINEKKIEVDP